MFHDLSEADRRHADWARVDVGQLLGARYALTFHSWGLRRELPAGELANYTAHKNRMRVAEDKKVSSVLSK
jgi:hypothetical protein